MESARGIEKLADEYLVGIVSFIYSASATMFIVFWKPLTILARSRNATKDTIRILPSSVALLLYIFPVFYLQKWSGGDPALFIADIEFSGLNWYEKLILITTLYICCDCVVRVLSWTVSRNQRSWRANHDRLRYAAAGFFVAFDLLGIARPLVKNPQIPYVLFSLVAFYPAIVLFGRMLCIRLRWSKFVAAVIVAHIGAAVVIGATAIFITVASASFGTFVSNEIRLLQPTPPMQWSSAEVTHLRCSIMPDGHIAVVVVIANTGDYALPFSPDEFVLELTGPTRPPLTPPNDPSVPRAFRRDFELLRSGGIRPSPKVVRFPLHADINDLVLLRKGDAQMWTFSLTLTTDQLNWPMRETTACQLRQDESRMASRTRVTLGSNQLVTLK